MSKINIPEQFNFKWIDRYEKLRQLVNMMTAITVLVEEVKSDIDWEKVFDDAQTMHQQEFISHYKNQIK